MDIEMCLGLDTTIDTSVGLNTNVNNILDEIQKYIIIDYNTNNFEHDIKLKIIDKIFNNIYIIKNLHNNYLFNCDENTKNKINSLLNTLKLLYNKKTVKIDNISIKLYKNIKKTLGHIIYDIYRDSGYHILISNVPLSAIAHNDNLININNIDNIDNIEYINSEIILDTVESCIEFDTVEHVLQTSHSAYMVKFKSYNDSIRICNILNNKKIGDNIIKVELLNENPIEVEVKPVEIEVEVKPVEVEVKPVEVEVKPVEVEVKPIDIYVEVKQLEENIIKDTIELPTETSITNSNLESFELISDNSEVRNNKDNKDNKNNESLQDDQDDQDDQHDEHNSNVQNNNYLVVNLVNNIYDKVFRIFNVFGYVRG